MNISVEVFESRHESAVAAFNRRMLAANASTAFLAEELSRPPLISGSVKTKRYVAVDDTGAVRGGVLTWEHPALVGTEVRHTINLQSPLSEGIIDPAYIFVAAQIVKHILRQTPYVYVVGMGAIGNPLPRLLGAMGWTVRAIPFYFRMINAARCARELGPLRSSPLRRIAGTLAAVTGTASMAAVLAHGASPEARRAAQEHTTTQITNWASWADELWSEFARHLSFGVLRTTDTLPFLYPLAKDELLSYQIKNSNKVEGWFGLAISKNPSSSYFGNLRVATLSDCVGSPTALQAAGLLAITAAKSAGADLIVTNQAHTFLVNACQSAGWRQGPSNYLLATSKALTQEVKEESVYVTRRDGDGLVNLVNTGVGDQWNGQCRRRETHVTATSS